MDTLRFVEQCLSQVHERLVKSLRGLSEEDLTWRPAPHANSIVEILWHLARTDDRMGRTSIGLGPDVWDSQEWYKCFGYPKTQPEETDFELINAGKLPIPRLEHLVAYMEAIHEDTLEKLQSLSPSDLTRIANAERPALTIAAYFRHMITHKNNHHGQIDYIRGLVQPGWDLPAGTGMAQDKQR